MSASKWVGCLLAIIGLMLSAAMGMGCDAGNPTLQVRGTVTDAASGEPVVGARVSDHEYGSPPYRGATTDAAGVFAYVTWPEEHWIQVEKDGYESQRVLLEIKPDAAGSAPLEIALTPSR